MSATSGIGISQELSDAFAAAVESKNVRFVKVAIKDEVLSPDGIFPLSGSFDEDLEQLQDILGDDEPAYILARLDGGAATSEWFAINYVPESAKVRDKMLYASTRNSLTKSLGSTHFTDSIFATSKADLTPSAYAAHRAHIAAPKPLSAREQEMADVRAAERLAGGTSYEGMRSKKSHVGAVGLAWTEDVEAAVKELADGDGDRLVVLSVDSSTETLVLSTAEDRSVGELSTALPASEPCFAFFAWNRSHSAMAKRDIIFIYSCPSSSPIKHRMIYSSGALAVHRYAKTLLSSTASTLVERKVETSDPKELDEMFLISALGFTAEGATSPAGGQDKKPFARPRGPARKDRT